MNLADGGIKVSGDIQLGNLSSPVVHSAGTGAIVTTNKPNGSLHWRTDADTLPELMHNSEARKLGLSEHSVECRLATLTANTANTYTTYAPCDGIITDVRRRFLVGPASASGTVVTGITIGGNQILASASENEVLLADDTLGSHNLTATSAHLKFSKGDKIVITVTSNNADMTGGTEPMFYLDYDNN